MPVRHILKRRNYDKTGVKPNWETCRGKVFQTATI